MRLLLGREKVITKIPFHFVLKNEKAGWSADILRRNFRKRKSKLKNPKLKKDSKSLIWETLIKKNIQSDKHKRLQKSYKSHNIETLVRIVQSVK